jgi:transposase
MVREFDVALDELHNDSTTLTLQGQYRRATGKRVRGKPTLRAALGFNKDYRPDLKQLVWILTVSADGSVPVHFKVADGNTEDSTTHIETWMALRRLVGSANFLYVSDCKLCTRENLKYIYAQGGRFVTVLPRTWKEDSLFKDWIQNNTPAWEEIARRPHPRLQDGPPDIFVAVASPFVDPDCFRVVWYKSSHKMVRDAETRGSLLEEANKALDAMRAKLEGPRSRWRSRAKVVQAVDAIVATTGAGRWLDYEVTSVEEPVFRQEKRGRPGEKTRWRRRVKTSFRLTWTVRQEQIAYDSLCDGLFPLITNESISPQELLDAYKSRQPLVERQHHILKTLQATVPIYLKSISRIEALLFLSFVALLVNALLERAVRRAMERRGIKKLPLYPEERACRTPSAERILEIFGPAQRALLYNKRGALIQRFDPELNTLQRKVLGLLGVSAAAFNEH